MASRSDQDISDDFSELYKEYTRLLGSKASDVQDKEKTKKRSPAGSDNEMETRDPNAVPTDFTSREAKVWESKSKATERNWKKRKEEEMICKICGETGHFTQGCPSTLGGNRKSQDFFEKLPARERHVKSLFPEKVIIKIEMDIGCKIRMEEKFIIVSGKDRLIVKKGVDAVHKLIEEGGDHRGSSRSHISRSRSPEISPLSSWSQHSDHQRSHSAPRHESHFQQRFPKPDKVFQDRVHDKQRKFSRDSPQAYGNEEARGRASHSKSPAQPHYLSNSYNSFEGHNQSLGAYRTNRWESEQRGSDLQSGYQLDQPSLPRTLEELEMEFKKDARNLKEFGTRKKMKKTTCIVSFRGVTIEVQKFEDFTWLNASYVPVLKQLQDSETKSYYFSGSNDNGRTPIKFRNLKYLSMLNHLRFYIPEVFPSLKKMVFLDDDVVQKDLSGLLSIDLNGNVNGAVETCMETFHRYHKYLNYSHPPIRKHFDRDACGWAFGMNVFDLVDWRNRNVTGIYHYW